jgi:hypothetical protein
MKGKYLMLYANMLAKFVEEDQMPMKHSILKEELEIAQGKP